MMKKQWHELLTLLRLLLIFIRAGLLIAENKYYVSIFKKYPNLAPVLLITDTVSIRMNNAVQTSLLLTRITVLQLYFLNPDPSPSSVESFRQNLFAQHNIIENKNYEIVNYEIGKYTRH